ncbi:hypothetical protein Hanom_Chr03g00208971 [Helianthus anomalus]
MASAVSFPLSSAELFDLFAGENDFASPLNIDANRPMLTDSTFNNPASTHSKKVNL